MFDAVASQSNQNFFFFLFWYLDMTQKVVNLNFSLCASVSSEGSFFNFTDLHVCWKVLLCRCVKVWPVCCLSRGYLLNTHISILHLGHIYFTSSVPRWQLYVIAFICLILWVLMFGTVAWIVHVGVQVVRIFRNSGLGHIDFWADSSIEMYCLDIFMQTYFFCCVYCSLISPPYWYCSCLSLCFVGSSKQ